METEYLYHIELANDFIRPTTSIIILPTKKNGKPQSYIAWVDSGATRTAFSKRVMNELSLIKGKPAIVNDANSKGKDVDTYLIKFFLKGTDSSEMENEIYAIELKTELEGCDLLIGLDILQYANFQYDGPKKKFILEF